MAASPDSVPVARLAVIGFTGIVFTYISVLLLQALYYRETGLQWQEKVVSTETAEADGVLAGQQEALRSYGVVDREAGTYQIPVERAMALELQDATR
jgi:hypothetical protein